MFIYSERPNIRTRISALKTLTSTFAVNVPGGGAYTTAYDIWSGRSVEIMLWVNKQGAVAPWADLYDANGNPIPRVSGLNVGGHTWNAYFNGGSGSIDVLAVLKWIQSQGWISDISVENVQFGFEITSSPGGMAFTVTGYDVAYTK